MDAPTRRETMQVIAGTLLGLGSYLQVPDIPGFFGGYLRASPLEPHIDEVRQDELLPPDEFVTPADDDRLADLDSLQEALQRASEQVELSRREFGETFSVLRELPIYEPTLEERQAHPAVRRGIYVSDEEYTYRINLQPRCSDRWWIQTKGTPVGQNSCQR